MKKLFIMIIVLLLSLFSLTLGYGESKKIVIKVQKGNKTMYINDKPLEMDVAPIEVPPGRIMVPVRFVSEGLGAEVGWDEKTETVTIIMDSIPYLKYRVNQLEKENEDLKQKILELENKIGEQKTYYVKRVIDGDTIELEDGTKIRYIGINAPEKGQNFYEEATQRNRELVEGKEVRLEYDVQKFDQYGRTLAYVFVGNIFVNLQLVKEGLAVIYTVPPNVKYTDQLYQAEQYAKEHELGIWKKSEINLKITYIKYDAPGNDNYNLNGEWVEITNLGKTSIEMTGFILRDEANHEFLFPTFVLSSGDSVKVYSGCGTNTSSSLYWCSDRAIWNNDGDTAFLYDSKGNLIDTYSY